MSVQEILIWVMMGAYVVMYLCIGYIGRKFSRVFPQFATAHGKFNPLWIGLATGATLASANLYIGVPGWAYKYGYPVFWWVIGNSLTISIGLALFARRFFLFYKKEGFHLYTLPHWLGAFYGSKSLRFGVAILALFNTFYIAGQNIGLATVLEKMNGLPYRWGVVLTVAVIVTYSIFGGRYAGIITDVIQWFLKCTAGLIVFGSIFVIFGSNAILTIHDGLKAQDPTLVNILAKDGIFSDWISIISIQWLLFTFILLPHLGSIILTLKEEKDVKPFVWSSSFGFFFASSFMWVGGLAARVLYPNLANHDSAIPTYIANNFHPILAGFVVGGIMAAVMSTADSLYIGISTEITNDILFMKESKYKVPVSRLAIVLVGILSAVISFNRPASLTMLTQFGISAIISGIAVIIGYAHFGKRKLPGGAAFFLFLQGSSTYLFLALTGLVENIFKALLIASIGTLISLFLYLRCVNPAEKELPAEDPIQS